MAELNPSEEQLLARPTGALVVFSDTITQPGGNSVDFDSELTTAFRTLAPAGNYFYGINGDITRGAYGVELMDHLLRGAEEDVGRSLNSSPNRIHATVQEAQAFLKERAVRVVANSAPRNGRVNENGQHVNGTDFYLAITKDGLEVYATPLEILKYLKERLLSVFRIPNQGHPLFHGKREQFRSSLIARSGEVPEHLVRVDNFDEVIPDQVHRLEVAFCDAFGNLRLRTNLNDWVNNEVQGKRNNDGIVGIRINERILEAHCVSGLDEVPGGKGGFYQNVADGEQYQNGSGYWEAVIRLEDGLDAKAFRTYQSAERYFAAPNLGSRVELVTI